MTLTHPHAGLKAFFTTPQLEPVDKLANSLALGTSPIVRALFDPEGGMQVRWSCGCVDVWMVGVLLMGGGGLMGAGSPGSLSGECAALPFCPPPQSTCSC